MGLYNATKRAIKGISESLASETWGHGINTPLVEPITAYNGLKTVVNEQFKTLPNGNPDATAVVNLKLVVAQNPPLRIFLGKTILPCAKHAYAHHLAERDQWNN